MAPTSAETRRSVSEVVHEDGASSSGHGRPPLPPHPQCHNTVDFKNQLTVLERCKV